MPATRSLSTSFDPPVIRSDVSLAVVVAIACVAQFMVILDTTIVNVALPEMKHSLDLSINSQQWVIDGYLITFGGLMLLASRASDLFGRKLMFQAGLIVFSGASLVGGLAGSGALLLIARIIQGAGAAALAPSTLSLITATHTDPAQRTRALALWSVAGASGGGAGLVLGGALTSALNWRWVLFVNVPIGIGVLAAVTIVLLPSAHHGKRPRLDVPGAITATLGFGLLVYAISKVPQSGWGSASVLIGLIASVILLTGFVLIELRSPEPLIPMMIFKHRNISAANLIFTIVGAVMTGTLFFLSLYLQQVLGESALRTGLSMLPWSVAVTASTFASRRLIPLIGARVLLILAGVIAVVGLAWLSRLPTHSAYLLHVCVPTLVAASGLGLTFLPLAVTATTGVAPRDAGVASGLFNVARQIGGALGLAMLVTIAASATKHDHHVSALSGLVHGYHVALLAAAGLVVLATASAMLVRPQPNAPASTASEKTDGLEEIETQAEAQA